MQKKKLGSGVAEYDKVSRVVVCSPQLSALKLINQDNYKRYLFRKQPDRLDDFVEEHRRFVDSLRESEVEVIDIAEIGLPPNVEAILRRAPNLIFTRDSAVTTPSGALVLNMATKERRMEPQVIEEVLRKCSVPIIGHVPNGVLLEGGDIIFIRQDVVFVGYGPRTTFSGVNYLSQVLLKDCGLVREVVGIEIMPERINLDGVLMPLHERLILMDRSAVSSHVIRFHESGRERLEIQECLTDLNMDVLEVGKDEGLMLATNVLHLGNRVVLAYAHNKRVNAMLGRLGYTVKEISGNDLVNGSGGPRCMANPIGRC